MIDNQPYPQLDVWSEWLLHYRHADDPAYESLLRTQVERYADRILDAAQLTAGMTLADIGAGDGLVAFRAIDRVGPSLSVVLTDISAPLLRHTEALAIERHVRQQCIFLRCSAQQLLGIPDASVDVVTTRAVLAYVAEKLTALGEFRRILKPGGRISIAEPVLQDEAFVTVALRMMAEKKSGQPEGRILSLLHRWRAAQYPDTHEKIAKSPIANYSERNLLQFVQRSGFAEIHLELHIDILPSITRSWDVFLGSSPHPLAPPLSTILAEQFTAEERDLFERFVRPQVESPQATTTNRVAYLSAKKPLV